MQPEERAFLEAHDKLMNAIGTIAAMSCELDRSRDEATHLREQLAKKGNPMPNWTPTPLIANRADEEEVLTLLGQIATAQPMQSRSCDAEELLKKIGHSEYTRRCDECQEVPAEPAGDNAVLCRACRY